MPLSDGFFGQFTAGIVRIEVLPGNSLKGALGENQEQEVESPN